jgi:hypothetical protein
MQTRNLNSVFYSPQIVPSNPADLPNFLRDELVRLQTAINLLAMGHVDVTHVAPLKPRDGDFRFADGTDWNPGSGRGIYYYDSGWIKL